MLLGKLRHTFEERQLIVEVVVGAVKPKPRTDCAVNSQRPADGIAEIAILRARRVSGLPQFPRRSHALHPEYRASRPSRRSGVGTAGPGAVAPEKIRWVATSALFQCRFHLLLLQFPLQLAEVFKRLLVIAVHGNPFAPLGRWIHRVHAERQITREMAADRRRG